MKVAIYARVSTEKQAQEGTIESQLVALREYADANAYEILEECIDDGYSGTNLVRPGLDHLRDLAQQGLIAAVVMLSPDRLAAQPFPHACHPGGTREAARQADLHQPRAR